MPGRLTDPKEDSEALYHILLTISNIKHDPTSEIQKVRVCGTYVYLDRAKAEAHRVLFEAGYEKEWFTAFDARRSDDPKWSHADGIIVYAVAPEGEIFTVSIVTTANVANWKCAEDGRIEKPLFHLLQTVIFYDKDVSGESRETNVLSSHETYEGARIAAQTALLSVEDGITSKGSQWAEYDSLPLKERDWEFGENVVVHAVGQGGENVILSVVEAQESNTVRMEAAMRIR
jgi:hypothetical protein